MASKMRILETTKKYKYNTKRGKTEWMMIKNSRKKIEKEIDMNLEVKGGKIGRTNEYKYLGDKYDEKGNNESKITYKTGKLDLMISDIKKESNEKIVGKASVSLKLMLIEIIITPTVLSSTETWHNITKHEENMIKQIHQKTLTRLLLL